MASRIWFITGCASGFGRALAEMALARGDSVVATDRALSAVAGLAAEYPATALALGVDVTVQQQVRAGLDAAFARFGRIDVLVNNAGFGVQSAVEEADMDRVRAMFEVNFFGMIDVIRAALPRLRAQGAGHIVNFGSVGGRVAGPLMGLYSASKFAVEGMSEALAAELAPFGIRVTVVEPGAFATSFAAASQLPRNPLPPYEPVRAWMHGLIEKLPQGDARDLAGAICEFVDAPDPPRQFIGGSDAYDLIERSLAAQQAEMETWRELSARANTAALGMKADFGI